MRKQHSRRLGAISTSLFFLFFLHYAVHRTSFYPLGLTSAFAGGKDNDKKKGGNKKQSSTQTCSQDGKITLDASRASAEAGGTVWSNTDLISGSAAKKDINVGLKTDSNLTTIINQAGSDGLLSETATEFNSSKQTYTNLKDPAYTGGIAPLAYFDNPSGQLFDFGRYKAASLATQNALSWSEFEAKVQNNEVMHGIVYVTLDALEGTKKLQAGSINVKGTLVIDLINGTPSYKMFVEVPININPVISPTTGTTTLSPADFDNWTNAAAARTNPADPVPWPSGYEGGWNEVASYAGGSKDPRGKAIPGYESFGQYEDMPALMYSGGIVDIHHQANISGVVYTPDFVEIEQKQKNNEVQYINGAVIGGNGIYLESNTCGGGIAIAYNPDTLDSMKVAPSPSSMKRAAWKIE